MQGPAGTGRPPGKQFPVGFRFNPTDELLMGNYLYKRLKGILKENEKAMVPECNLYGKNEPWEIWEMFGGDRLPDSRGLFLFTTLKRKGTGKHFHRTVGYTHGLWERIGHVRIQVWVKGEDNKTHCVKGSKRKFRYKNYIYPFSDQKGRWVINEYTISGESDSRESNDVALCLLCKIDIPVATSKGQGNAEILATASAKNKRKLNAYENWMATNQELLGNIQRSMNLRSINEGGAPIAATAPIDGLYILESSGQETTGPARLSFSTADENFSSDCLMDLNFSTEELLELKRIFCPTASSEYPEPGYPTMGNWDQPGQLTMEQQPQCTSTQPGNHPTPPPYCSNYPTRQPSWYQSNPSTTSQTPQQPQCAYTQPGNHPTLPPYYNNYPTEEPSWYQSNPSTISQTPQQPHCAHTQPGNHLTLPPYYSNDPTQQPSWHQSNPSTISQTPQQATAEWNINYSYSQMLPVASHSYDRGYSQQPPNYGQSVPNQFTTMEQQNPYALPPYGPPNVASQLSETVSSQLAQLGANPQAYSSSSSFTGQRPVQSGYEQTFHSQTAYEGLQQSQVPPSTAQSIYGQGGYSLQPDPAPENYLQGTHPVAYGQPWLETQPPSQPTNIGLSQPFVYGPEANDENLNADNVSDPVVWEAFPSQS